MSDVAAPLSLALPRASRPAALAAAAALGLSAGLLGLRLSPTLPPALALGAGVGLAALTLAALIEAAGMALWAKIFALAAAVCALAAVAPDALRLPVALLSLGLLGAGAVASASGARLRLPNLFVTLALIAGLGAFNVWQILASQDLQIADFMFYRVVSIAAGTLAREGKLAALAINLAGSMPKDYSWAPAILPGFALAAFGLLSRAVYQGALVVFYAAPALLALAWAARRMAGAKGAAALAFAAACVAAAYPFGLVVEARGMPDIGGLALFALALALAEKLARTLALTHDRPALARRLAFALALTLFALFLFRRWYAFAATALIAALALEAAASLLRLRAKFPWRAAAQGASVGALTLAALLAPVLMDWLPNPQAHDYARLYAAYRKTPSQLAEAVGDWAGFAPLVLALAGGLFMMARAQTRFVRLAFLSGPLAALLFSRVQSPYPHHLYLLAPFLTLFIAAPLTLLFQRSRAAALALMGTLAALTMTPLGAYAPRGVFPVATPRPPRADLAELARLREVFEATATPSHKVCGLGSSYTFSGQLIAELWQLKAQTSPLQRRGELPVSVGMPDVDEVDGPPTAKLKECAVLIVGDPVQTHVIASHQLTVTLPSQEVLEGTGIGAHYRRTGEVFALEKGVKAVVFEQTSPLTDADMEALTARWRAAKAQQK